MFRAALFTMPSAGNSLSTYQYMSGIFTNNWNTRIKKWCYIYTMEYYVAERKEEFLPVVIAWMNLENITLREIRQVVKEKYHMLSPIRGI